MVVARDGDVTGLVRRGTWPGEPRVATLTLASPGNRNALSRTLVEDLVAGLAAAGADDDVRAVAVLADGPAFCAGADLAEALAEGMATGSRRLVALLRAVVACPKPVVAVVDGHVRAGGTGLVAACDVALCRDSVTFAFTEVRLSLAPAVVSLTVLPRLTDRGAALALLGGEPFDGIEAERLGLVTRAVAADDLTAAVAEVLAALCRGTPQGLAETKRLLTAPLLDRIDLHGEATARTSADLFASEPARHAIRAVLHRPATPTPGGAP
jgi:enoyl-CoA hydratase/methylglutaconyl-CoA hydratase